MNTVKRILTITLMLMLLIGATANALANIIVPLADDVFDATKVQLSSTGKVTLYCVTYDVMNSIKVTSCWLEKKQNGVWVYDCSVTPPSEEGVNTIGYSATLECKSSIGSGTYRFAATFSADGHRITRYSTGTSF